MLINPACIIKSKNFKNQTADLGLIFYNSLTKMGFVKEVAFKVEKENIFLYSQQVPVTASIGFITSRRSFLKFYILVERITEEEYIISVHNRNVAFTNVEAKTLFEEMFELLENKFKPVTFSKWFESSEISISFTSNETKFRKLVRKKQYKF